jgi:hypothetical protein
MFIANLIIYFIIATIPLLFAAVQPWIWSVYTACILAAFILFLWQPRNRRSGVSDRLFIFTLAIFFAATLLQCMPLPANVLSVLSHFRFHVLDESSAINGGTILWQAISYANLISLSWWIFFLSLLMFFLVLRKSFTLPNKLKLIVGIMLGIAAIESLYGLIQALVPNMGLLWVDYIKDYEGDARGTFINRNHFAGLIEMVWPLGLGITLAQGNWKRQLLYSPVQGDSILDTR